MSTQPLETLDFRLLIGVGVLFKQTGVQMDTASEEPDAGRAVCLHFLPRVTVSVANHCDEPL